MIFPVSVTEGTFRYTLDALLARSDDLRRVGSLVAQASALTGLSAGPINDPAHILFHADLVSMAADLATIRADLDGVIAAIEPAEFARASVATGAPWPVVRLLSESLTQLSPWSEEFPRATPIRETERRDDIAPPRNLSDRLDRIPDSDSPIRIDRFETSTGPRFELYIAGTDFSAGPANPWWAGGNLEMFASGQSRSLAATETALRAAGVAATTPLVITGHSQGGLIAIALAASPRYSVDGIVTIGSPVGVVEEIRDTPAIHIAHPEDPVPALGGTVSEASGTTWLAHSEPRRLGADAHVLKSYRSTVARIDAMGEFDLLGESPNIAGPGTAVWYRTRSTE